jgi:hypothetical protein
MTITEIFTILAFIVVWVALQSWLLPRMGVPT